MSRKTLNISGIIHEKVIPYRKSKLQHFTNTFVTLLWKNFLLYIRHPYMLGFCVAVPIITFFVLSMVSLKSSYQDFERAEYPIRTCLQPINNYFIAYRPANNEQVNQLIANLQEKRFCQRCKFQAFETELEVIRHYFLNNVTNMIAIYFANAKNNLLPDKLDVEIRFNYDLKHPNLNYRIESWITTKTARRDENGNFNPGEMLRDMATPDYLIEGFIPLQIQIGLAYLQIKTGKMTDYRFHIQQFPYRSILVHGVLGEYSLIYTRLIFYIFLIFVIFVTVPFAKERQNKQYRYFKLIGINIKLNIFAWYISAMIICFTVVLVIIVFHKFGHISGHPEKSLSCFSNTLILLIFYLLYLSAFILLNMFLAALINHVYTMITMCILVHSLLYYHFSQDYFTSDDVVSNYIFRLIICHKVYKIGCQCILMDEIDLIGVQWSNLFDKNSALHLSMGEVLITLMFHNIFYFILLLLTDIPLYKNGSITLKITRAVTNFFYHNVTITNHHTSESYTYENFEVPASAQKIRIENLHTYRKYAKARLSGINFIVEANKIIAIYGPPNSGKSELLKAICGDIPSRVGDVILGKRADKKLCTIGCGANLNYLYDELTAEEHLLFYTCILCKEKTIYKYQMEFFLSVMFVNIKYAKQQVMHMNYDYKRKLCACLGFCGTPDIVLLDDPSICVSETTRNSIWNLIDVERIDKAIIIATQNMGEAEFLADRICIINYGHQMAYGSPIFLRKITGANYYLTLLKEVGCDVNRITMFIRQYVPGCRVFYNLEMRLEYILDRIACSTLYTLIQSLDARRAKLRIKRIDIRFLTLEEIFTSVTDGMGDIVNPNKRNIPVYKASILPRSSVIVSKDNMLQNLNSVKLFIAMKGNKLRWQQWKAILAKDTLGLVRTYYRFILNVLICVFPLILLQLYQENMDRTYRTDPVTFPMILKDLDILVQNPKSIALEQTFINDAKKYLKKYHRDVIPVKDVYKFIETEPAYKTYQVIAAMKVEGRNLIGLYNQRFFHGDAHIITLFINILLLRYGYEIKFENEPLTRPLYSRLKEARETYETCPHSHGITLSLAVATGLVLKWLITERINRTEHLVRFYGSTIFNAWLIKNGASFIMLFLHVLMIFILASAFSAIKSFDSVYENLVLILTFAVFIIAALNILSYYIKEPDMGFNMSVFFVFLALLTYCVCLDLFTPSTVFRVFDWLFLPIPMLSICSALDRINKWDLVYSQCQISISHCIKYDSETGVDCNAFYKNAFEICRYQYFPNYNFTEYSILPYLLTNVGLAIVASIISLAFDYNIFTKLKYVFKSSRRTMEVLDTKDDDDDVITETRIVQNILNLNLTDYLLVVHDLKVKLTKDGNNKGLNFALKSGECFAILGPFKSGKSVIVETLIGNRNIICGDVIVNGYNLKYHRRNVFEYVGYNPDPKSLPPLLKVKELFFIVGSMRGLQKKMCYSVMETMCKEMNIHNVYNMQIRQLNLRSLYTITVLIALIGDPKLLILDSPTRGMDIEHKIRIWKLLQQQLKKGKGILMTTDSIQECQAICTRAGLFTNGCFKMLGSISHLQLKNSHTIQIVLFTPRYDEHVKHVEVFMNRNFICVLKQRHIGKLVYQISESSVNHWQKLLGTLENGRQHYFYHNYYVGRSNLVQLFSMFTLLQREE